MNLGYEGWFPKNGKARRWTVYTNTKPKARRWTVYTNTKPFIFYTSFRLWPLRRGVRFWVGYHPKTPLGNKVPHTWTWGKEGELEVTAA